MRRLLSIAALVVVGCAAQKVDEKPLPSGTVEVATFTAEVDPGAGTIQVRSQPTAAGRALGVNHLVEVTPADVSVANTRVGGQPQIWFNAAQGGPVPSCTNGHLGTVWGANVTITTLAANTILSNVYSQIVSFAGTTGQEACNSVVAPSGLADPGLGLWSTPVVSGGVATQDWVFKYASSLPFTFSGRVMASVTRLFPSSTIPLPDEGIVDNGTGVVYSDYNFRRLVFLEPGSGGTWSTFPSVGIPDFSWALSKDVNHGLIWYATSNVVDALKSYVGYVTSGDHGASGSSVVVENVGSATTALRPWSIKADPDPAKTRAWFVASDWVVGSAGYTGARLFYVDAAAGVVSAPVQVSILDGLLARSLAFGADGKVYVTLAPSGAHSTGAIQRCTEAGCGGATPDVITLAASCADPSDILLGPGNKLWFTAKGPTGGVCTLDPANGNLVVRVADAPNPGYLAVGAAGDVWVAENGAVPRAQRIKGGSPPLYVTTNASPIYGTVWSLDALWIVVLDGINRITP
jgi:hypothetical protein